jgi:hypothetical protein
VNTEVELNRPREATREAALKMSNTPVMSNDIASELCKILGFKKNDSNLIKSIHIAIEPISAVTVKIVKYINAKQAVELQKILKGYKWEPSENE